MGRLGEDAAMKQRVEEVILVARCRRVQMTGSRSPMDGASDSPAFGRGFYVGRAHGCAAAYTWYGRSACVPGASVGGASMERRGYGFAPSVTGRL